MRRIDLTDPNPPEDRRNHAEKVKLLITQGTRESWGDLEPLHKTSWEAGVEFVTAESMSHALHGHIMPLLRELGRDPRSSARRVTPEEGLCTLQKDCISWRPELCRPGGSRGREEGPPACYDPPLESGTNLDLRNLFRSVAQAWKEGRHTVVVLGDGFNLL